jgi:phage baseplate assembly protein W
MKTKLGRGTIVAPTNTTTLALIPNIKSSPAQTSLTDVRTNPTQTLGPTGIKFPFRFSSSGRVAVSTTTINDTSHIKESIEQILFTAYRERLMLPLFGSPLNTLTFEPQEAFKGLVESEIVDALETYEKRIQLTKVNYSIQTYDLTVTIDLFYFVILGEDSIPVQQTITLG